MLELSPDFTHVGAADNDRSKSTQLTESLAQYSASIITNFVLRCVFQPLKFVELVTDPLRA